MNPTTTTNESTLARDNYEVGFLIGIITTTLLVILGYLIIVFGIPLITSTAGEPEQQIAIEEYV